jgi:ABC-type glycerol-3-phosphate transport system substrate-binding protein
MTRATIALAALLVLAACGGRVALKPQAGKAMPPKAETAAAAPTPDQLMTADSQARPKRSDEQLKRSEERREDKFDLPPS